MSARDPAGAPAETGRSEARAREILRRRARALAQRVELSEDMRISEVVCVRLGLSVLAIAAPAVYGVIPYAGVTKLPHSPAGLRGIVGFRGQVLPLFDVRERFGIKHESSSDGACVIAVGGERAELALLGDELLEVASLAGSEVAALPPSQSGAELLEGLTSAGWLVLSTSALLRDPRLTLDKTAPAS